MSTSKSVKPVRVVFIVKPNDHPALYRWITEIPSRRVAHTVRERLDIAIRRAEARKSPQSRSRSRSVRRAPLLDQPQLEPLTQVDAAEAPPETTGQQGQRNSSDVINEMWEMF